MRFNYLVKEWAWRVNNGMPDPKKRTHLQILEDVLRDYKYSEEFIQEYILQIEAVCKQGQNPGRDGCVAADGAKGAFRIARSAQIKTDPNIVKEMDELKSPLDDTKTTTDVDLVATKTLIGTQRIKGTADAADSNLLKNISLDFPNRYEQLL